MRTVDALSEATAGGRACLSGFASHWILGSERGWPPRLAHRRSVELLADGPVNYSSFRHH